MADSHIEIPFANRDTLVKAQEYRQEKQADLEARILLKQAEIQDLQSDWKQVVRWDEQQAVLQYWAAEPEELSRFAENKQAYLSELEDVWIEGEAHPRPSVQKEEHMEQSALLPNAPVWQQQQEAMHEAILRVNELPGGAEENQARLSQAHDTLRQLHPEWTEEQAWNEAALNLQAQRQGEAKPLDPSIDLDNIDGEEMEREETEDRTWGFLVQEDLSEQEPASVEEDKAQDKRETARPIKEKLTRELVEQALAVGASLQNKDLSGLDLSNLSFQGVNLSGSDLSGTINRNTIYEGGWALGSDFSRARFESSVLADVNFAGSTWKDAQFRHTRITNNNFTRATFEGNVLTGDTPEQEQSVVRPRRELFAGARKDFRQFRDDLKTIGGRIQTGWHAMKDGYESIVGHVGEFALRDTVTPPMKRGSDRKGMIPAEVSGNNFQGATLRGVRFENVTVRDNDFRAATVEKTIFTDRMRQENQFQSASPVRESQPVPAMPQHKEFEGDRHVQEAVEHLTRSRTQRSREVAQSR